MSSRVVQIQTSPFKGQMPGTSGLRKKVSVFSQALYVENFVQSIFNANFFPSKAAIVIGGDGRYYNEIAIQSAIKVCLANNISHLIIGRSGLLSTPAASNLIRSNNASGGIIFSASHNPGGKNADFGVKINSSCGAPISDQWIDRIYKKTLKIKTVFKLEIENIKIENCQDFFIGSVRIQVVDSVISYTRYMEQLFDFSLIRDFVASGFNFKFDAMHGVSGPYAKKIFEELLCTGKNSVLNYIPLPDFGGVPPDPCRKNAPWIYSLSETNRSPDLCALSDGDGDRYVILGRNFQLSPSDSLAIILSNAKKVLRLKKDPVGVARSLPTSRAVDVVAASLGIACFETPTGWKYFANLLEAGKIDLCGEESAGASSNHIREKDGIWAILFWLNILAIKNKPIETIVHDHWREFGRHVCMRYNFDCLSSEVVEKVFKNVARKNCRSRSLGYLEIESSKFFSYLDNTDNQIYETKALVINFRNKNARAIIRQSGTSSESICLRFYFELYLECGNDINIAREKVLEPIINTVTKLTCIYEESGTDSPTSSF